MNTIIIAEKARVFLIGDSISVGYRSIVRQNEANPKV